MPKLPLHPNCKCHYENVYEKTTRKISSLDPEKIIMPQMTPEQWDSQNESDKKKWCRLFSSKFGFYISTYAQISNVPKSLLSVIVANELMDWRNIDGTQLDGLKGGGVGYAQIAIDTALQEGVSGYEKELVKKMKNNKFVPDYISYRIISGKVHKELLSTRGSIKIAARLLRKYIEYYEIKVKNNDLGKGFQKTGLFFIKKRSIFDLDAQIADMQVPEPAFRIFCAIWNSGKEILDAKDKISESNYKNAYIHAENSLLAIEYLKELLSHEN